MYNCLPSELEKQTGKYLWEMYQDLLCEYTEAKLQAQKNKL